MGIGKGIGELCGQEVQSNHTTFTRQHLTKSANIIHKNFYTATTFTHNLLFLHLTNEVEFRHDIL